VRSPPVPVTGRPRSTGLVGHPRGRDEFLARSCGPSCAHSGKVTGHARRVVRGGAPGTTWCSSVPTCSVAVRCSGRGCRIRGAGRCSSCPTHKDSWSSTSVRSCGGVAVSGPADMPDRRRRRRRATVGRTAAHPQRSRGREVRPVPGRPSHPRPPSRSAPDRGNGRVAFEQQQVDVARGGTGRLVTGGTAETTAVGGRGAPVTGGSSPVAPPGSRGSGAPEVVPALSRPAARTRRRCPGSCAARGRSRRRR
jgi:hypothetical protein